MEIERERGSVVGIYCVLARWNGGCGAIRKPVRRRFTDEVVEMRIGFFCLSFGIYFWVAGRSDLDRYVYRLLLY